jgi:hypothetical protein
MAYYVRPKHFGELTNNNWYSATILYRILRTFGVFGPKEMQQRGGPRSSEGFYNMLLTLGKIVSDK